MLMLLSALSLHHMIKSLEINSNGKQTLCFTCNNNKSKAKTTNSLDKQH